MIPISGIAPFVAPFAVFMLFLVGVDGYFPDQHYALYPVKILLVMAALAWYWRRLPSLKPTALAGSLAVGTLGVVLWVGLDPWSNRLDDWIAAVWHRVMSLGGGGPATTCGRDPFRLYPAGEAWVLFAIRLGGIALVVPVMAELFWRGFLMRWLIKEDFASVPLGAYQALSFWATTVCFASVHGGEWPLALVVGTIYGAWFVRTKSLGSIMVAHGTTNFLLALYCLFSGDWHFLASASPAPPAK
jgi:CAAX prenyl protease-like protein